MKKLIKVKNKNTKNHDLESNIAETIRNAVLVGVLTTPKGKGKHPLPIGKDSMIKREMINAANEKGIFMYFFYPLGIDLGRQTVIGHTYLDNNKQSGLWVKGVFPLPDIVYNRISYRKIEAEEKVKELLARIESNPDIYLFNSRFLDKWEVHNILSQNMNTRDLVPEARLFNRENLITMLHKYEEIFIKPINNSVGKGIIKVKQKAPNKPIYYKIAASDGGWIQCNSNNRLYTRLKAAVTHDRYMIQKGIELATTNNRVFDLRTEVQKNDQGQWVFTGVGVRIAAPGKFVTHVPNGGSRANFDKVIKKVFGSSRSMKEYLEQQLAYISSVVPCVLERNLGINLGILSIDIGVNKSGLMQVIEVNSKPSSFDENDIRRQHLENLNKYFLYLSSLKIY